MINSSNQASLPTSYKRLVYYNMYLYPIDGVTWNCLLLQKKYSSFIFRLGAHASVMEISEISIDNSSEIPKLSDWNLTKIFVEQIIELKSMRKFENKII